MSLFYDILLSKNLSFGELEDLMIKIATEVFVSGGEIKEAHRERITSVYNDFMSLTLFRVTKAPEFKSDDYDLCLGYHISYYPASTLFKEWPRFLMRFCDRMLHSVPGDFVLEANGDAPVLERRNNQVYVDTVYFDRGTPFNELTMEYQKKLISQPYAN